MELATVLDELGFVAGFSDNEKEALTHALWEERFPDGHVFLREGSRLGPSDPALHLVLDGKVLLTVARRDESSVGTVRLLEAGEVFGLLALVDDGPRAATCRAAGAVRTASLSRQAFDLLYRANSRVASHFSWVIARQLARDLRLADEQLRKALEHGKLDAIAHNVLRG